MRGKVTRLLHSKGYGFVLDENNDVRFLHALDLMDQGDFQNLREGNMVEFEPTTRTGTSQRGKLNNGLGMVNVVRL